MKSYRDLLVWQKSMGLVKVIYQLTKTLPQEERYGLVSQMQRAAVSIPCNIAEGYGRVSTKDYIRFLNMARGSKYELETQLQICTMLGYLSQGEAEEGLRLCDEIGRMLSALIASIGRSQQATGTQGNEIP